MIKNQFKTAALLGLLTAVLLFVGNLLGGSNGLIIALIFSVLMNFGAYFWSDKIVLAMYKAKEVKENDYPELFKIVREITHLAGIPMPKMYIVPSQTPNAFATGRNPKHSVVACTEGILDLLTRDELKGVIAHEVSHIKNRDILIQTVAATIAGVISYVAIMTRWAAIFGGFGGRDRNSGSIVKLLVLAIVTPIVAVIIRLAISRSREYLADNSAAKTLHSGLGLASALEKLDLGVKRNPMRFGSESTSSLFIVNPFSCRGVTKLLSTHPPLKDRIKRLRSMSF